MLDIPLFKCTSITLRKHSLGTCRKKITVNEDRCFVLARYNYLELVVAAVLSGDPLLLKSMEQEIDLVDKIASDVTGKALSDVTMMDRTLAKAVIGGFLYDLTPKGLMFYAKSNYNLDMGRSVAMRAVDIHHNKYQVLTDWQNKTWSSSINSNHTGNKDKYQHLPMSGSDIYSLFTGKVQTYDKHTLKRSTVIYRPIQLTIALITRIAILALLRELSVNVRLNKFRFVITVNKNQNIEQASEHIKTLLQIIIQKVLGNINIPVIVNIVSCQ